MTRDPLPLVEIVWRDTVSDSSWQDDGEIEAAHPVICQTVGYLVRETPGCVTLSHTRCDDSGDYTTIPCGCIDRITRLKRNGPHRGKGTDGKTP